MKKLSACFLVVLAVIFSASIAFAGSADARTANYGQGINAVNGVGDLSTGNTAEVDSSGRLAIGEVSTAVSSGYNDALIYTGACKIKSITMKATSAGDSVAIYDAITATGTPKFDPSADTNAGSFTIDAKGAPFATGIYADCNDGDVMYSVVYDY